MIPVTGAILKSEVNDAARFLMVYDGLIIVQAWQAIILNTTAITHKERQFDKSKPSNS